VEVEKALFLHLKLYINGLGLEFRAEAEMSWRGVDSDLEFSIFRFMYYDCVFDFS